MTMYAKHLGGMAPGTTPGYAYHWQHNWHPYRKLASCFICFVLSLHSGI